MTINLVFDHRGRTQAGKEGPIEVRFAHNNKIFYVNTGIKVLSSQFRDGRIVNHGNKNELNERLAVVVAKMEKAISRCINEGKPIDATEIKRQIYNIECTREDEKRAMLDWLTEQVPLLNIGSGTRRRYDTLIRRMEEYGELTAWNDLTVENIYKFDRWLHQRKKAQSNGDIQAGREAECIGDAAVYNYHRTLKHLLSRAVKFNIIEKNPYDRIKGEFRKGIKESVEYLTEEEIAAIESLHPMEGSRMAMARDLFVFQMYTGLAYSDAQAFDMSDYKKQNGQWVHVGERIKTGTPYVSQLFPPVVEILERYGWQVPKIGNSQYNICLKTIQEALGIKTRLHSHLGRHTFGTRMLAMGVKIENVGKMLGHRDLSMTQRYAKVLAQSVHDDFEMVNKKLFNKKQK
jgi:integrase